MEHTDSNLFRGSISDYDHTARQKQKSLLFNCSELFHILIRILFAAATPTTSTLLGRGKEDVSNGKYPCFIQQAKSTTSYKPCKFSSNTIRASPSGTIDTRKASVISGHEAVPKLKLLLQSSCCCCFKLLLLQAGAAAAAQAALQVKAELQIIDPVAGASITRCPW